MSATAFQRRRRELAKENAVVVQDMTVMDREADTPLASPSERHPEIKATAAAQKKAEQLAVNLRQVVGTGTGGQITVSDIERANKPPVVE